MPVLEELHKRLLGQKAPPKSPPGQAVGYAPNDWEALRRYAEGGYLAVDNSLSVRSLRAAAPGRNNRGVIGSEAGGRSAAVLYSVVLGCKHPGIDPFGYPREAPPGLFAPGERPTAERLTAWLPDRWLLCRNRDSPATAASAG